MVGKLGRLNKANNADSTPGCYNIFDLREIGNAQTVAGA